MPLLSETMVNETPTYWENRAVIYSYYLSLSTDITGIVRELQQIENDTRLFLLLYTIIVIIFKTYFHYC